MKSRQMTRAGFTLLELLMVVIIIGILASIALPQFLRAAERSRASEALSILATMRSAQNRYMASDNNSPAQYLGTGQDCNLDIDMPSCGTNPPSANWTYSIDQAALACAQGSNCHVVATRNGGQFAGAQILLNLDSGALCGGAGVINEQQQYGVGADGSC